MYFVVSVVCHSAHLSSKTSSPNRIVKLIKMHPGESSDNARVCRQLEKWTSPVRQGGGSSWVGPCLLRLLCNFLMDFCCI